MNQIQRLEHWGDTHHPKWMDIVRIALGLFLLLKGIEFANNMNQLMAMMSGLPFGNFMMVKYTSYFFIVFIILFGMTIHAKEYESPLYTQYAVEVIRSFSKQRIWF